MIFPAGKLSLPLRRPLLAITIIFAACARFGVERFEYASGFYSCATALVVAFAVAFVAWLVSKKELLASVARVLGVCAIGVAAAYIAARSIDPILPANHVSRLIDENGSREKILVSGRVAEPPELRDGRVYLYVDVHYIQRDDGWKPVTGRVRLSIMRDAPWIRYGDSLVFPAVFRAAENYDNPGAFDYRRYLAAKGVFARASVSDGKSVMILRDWPPAKKSLRQRIEDLRSSLTAWILKLGDGAPGAGVMAALIVGERDYVPDEVNEAFQRTGAIHLLSVSGLHLAVVGSFFFFLAKWTLQRSERLMLSVEVTRIAALFSLPPMLFYCLLAGANPPTVRSLIMASAYALSLALRRDKDLLSTVALAALGIMIASPLAVIDVSFILSFTAVIGIVVAQPFLRKLSFSVEPETRESVGGRLREYVVATIVISVAITLFVGPLSLAYFNRVSVSSPLANLLYVPLIGYVSVISGLTAAMLHAITPSLGDALMRVSIVGLEWFVESMKSFAAFGPERGLLPTPTLLEGALFMAGTATAFMAAGASGRRRNLLGLAALACAMALVLDASVWHISSRGAGDLKATILDSGEGAAAVIRTPKGFTAIVDTGPVFPGFDAGERVVGPYLLHERIRRIDALVLTHPHSDHAGGFGWLMDNFDVREVWLADANYPPELMSDILEKIRRKGTPVRLLSANTQSFDFGGATVDVFWPRPGVAVDDPNDASLAIRFKLGGGSILFPGDNTENVHGELFSGSRDYRSTVLVVPHHGAKNGLTPTILDRTAPTFAAISSRFSMFHRFPSRESLALLEARRTPALRTDELGAILFRTDGVRMEVSEWHRGAWRRVER